MQHHVVVVVATLTLTRIGIHPLLRLLGLDEVEIVDLLDVLRILGQLVLLDVQLILSELLLVLVHLWLSLLSLVGHRHGCLGRLRLLRSPAWVLLRAVATLELLGGLSSLHGLPTCGLGELLQLLLKLLAGHPELLLLLALVHGRIKLLIDHAVILHALEFVGIEISVEIIGVELLRLLLWKAGLAGHLLQEPLGVVHRRAEGIEEGITSLQVGVDVQARW